MCATSTRQRRSSADPRSGTPSRSRQSTSALTRDSTCRTVPGPAGREVVVRQTQWDTVWHRLADTLPVPRANLTDSIVIIVATQEFSDGPHTLTIDGIRRCRTSGEIVVSLRRHDPNRRYDYGDRTILAVSLPRRTIESAPIRFVDLPHPRD